MQFAGGKMGSSQIDCGSGRLEGGQERSVQEEVVDAVKGIADAPFVQ